MQCQSCSKTIPLDTRFCPHCGAEISKQLSVKVQAEVTTVWLKEMFQGEGYTLEDAKGDEHGAFIAKHKDLPTMNISYRNAVNLIVMSIWWTTRKPSVFERREFQKIVNEKGNSLVCAQLSATPSMDAIRIQSTMYVCRQISNLDVLAFAGLLRDCSNELTPAFKKFYP
jgi:hypothetical protein